MNTTFVRLLAVAGFVAVGTPLAAQTSSAVEPRARSHRDAWFHRYQAERHGPEHTEPFSRTVRLGQKGFLKLSNISGDIVVSGGGGDEVRIEAVKRARAHDEGEAKRQLATVRIDVDELGDRAEVRTVHTGRHDRVSVDYTVSVPDGTELDLKSVSGDIRVTSIKGELRAESVSGDVHAGSVGRLSLLKSVSGDVQIAQAAAEGEVTAFSVSGNLVAKGLKARSLDAGTVSGDVGLTDVTCDRAHIRSVSGTIEYAGALAKNGRYDMTSHSGDVRLALAGTTGFELDASTFSGSVRSDLPVMLRAGDEGDRMRRQTGTPRHIRGTYGDGSALVLVRTFSGSVVVARR